ncbi:MAG: ASCH domain-containing protein [candidate division Zixibacteria bacterium]
MLLFKKEEFDDIRLGRITVTFRDWDKLRIEAGKEYKSFGLGYVRIEEVDYVDFKKILDEDLEAAGFYDLDEFKKAFRKRNPGFNFGSGRLIRIKFTYLGSEDRTAGGVKPAERDMIKIMERLVEIDVLSDVDVKSDDLLEFLDIEKAQNSVSIAKQFNISRNDVMKRMTALKNEGLINSRRDGYTISIRGKAYLDSQI